MSFSPTLADWLSLLTFLALLSAAGLLTALLIGRAQNSLLRLSFLELGLLASGASILVGSVVLIFTAEFGIFRIRYWIAFLTAFDLLAAVLVWQRSRTEKPWSTLAVHRLVEEWMAVPLLLMGLFLFLRTSEFITGSRDPGEYVNIAVQLSDTGTLRFKDDNFAGMDRPEMESLFLSAPLSQAPSPELIPGFYLLDPHTGSTVPQYFHLYPLWLSLAYKLWRFDGMFALNACLALLSCLTLVPLARTLFQSSLAGWVAAFLLASNLAQIWMARSPFSELLVQALFLVGLWLLALALREKHRRLAFLAGLLLALTGLVRIDSILLVGAAALSALFIWLWTPDRNVASTIRSFGVALALGTTHAIAHAAVFSRPYLENVLGVTRRSGVATPALALAALVLLAALLGPALRRLPARKPLDRAWLGPAWSAVCCVLVVLFLYGYWIRPSLGASSETIPLPPPHEGSVPFYNELNLVRLGWYATPLALFLAAGGSLIALRRLILNRDQILVPSLMILAAYTGFYLYKSQVFPDNYWVIRRYVPVVIPGFLLLAGLTVSSVHHLRLRVRWSGADRPFVTLSRLSLVLIAALGLWQAKQIRRAVSWREFTGAFRQIEKLASINQRADVVLLEYGPAQDFISSPLKVIFRQRVYPLATLQPDANALESLIKEWTAAGQKVQLVAFEENTALRIRSFDFVPAERFEVQLPIVEPTYESLPHRLTHIRFPVHVYEVQPRTEPEVSMTAQLGFGVRTEGFFPAEFNTDGEAYRWSREQAKVELPTVADSQDALLTLRLGRDIQGPLPDSRVRIAFNHVPLAEHDLTSRLEVASFRVPQSLLNREGLNRIEFSCRTFSPANGGGLEDTRSLGFMLAGLKLRSLQAVSTDNPFQIDLGSETDLLDAHLEGFFGREQGGYRWTAGTARLQLWTPLSGEPLQISLRAVKSCPDPSIRQFLAVNLGDVPLGRAELTGTGDRFEVVTFDIPSTRLSHHPSVLSLTVDPPWNPSQAGLSKDSRTLGCGIDWIRIGKRP
ncbi:MAG: hypothetical protein AB1898_06825 [Acidobacteriota bacterium]